MSRPGIRQWQPGPETAPPDLAALLSQVARGDHRAFELVYAELSGPVYGVVRQVLRDPVDGAAVGEGHA
jgi:RNA polymerase sigma-70 factor (ECF subfamily)